MVISREFNSNRYLARMGRSATTSEKILTRQRSSDALVRAPRAKVRMPVRLTTRPGFTAQAFFEDLSKDGFRLRSPIVLHVGQLISLEMPRETVACEVRWVDGFEAGGVFFTKPTLAVL